MSVLVATSCMLFHFSFFIHACCILHMGNELLHVGPVFGQMSPDISIIAKIKAIFGLLSSSLRIRPKPLPSFGLIPLLTFLSKRRTHSGATRRNTFSHRCSVSCSYSLIPEDMTTEMSWIKQQTASPNDLTAALLLLPLVF